VRARSSRAPVTEIVEGFANAVGMSAPCRSSSTTTTGIARKTSPMVRPRAAVETRLPPLHRITLTPSWATASCRSTEKEGRVRCGKSSHSPTPPPRADSGVGARFARKGLLGAGARVACGRRLAARTDAEPQIRCRCCGCHAVRYLAEELFRASSRELQNDADSRSASESLAPLIDLALQANSQSVIDEADRVGLATAGQKSAELHPLVREYLLTKHCSRARCPVSVCERQSVEPRQRLLGSRFDLVTRSKLPICWTTELKGHSPTRFIGTNRYHGADCRVGMLQLMSRRLIDLMTRSSPSETGSSRGPKSSRLARRNKFFGRET